MEDLLLNEKHNNLVKRVDEHDIVFVDITKRVSHLEVKEAVLSSKLDTTNKLLLGIFTILAGGMVALIFDIIKRGGLNG